MTKAICDKIIKTCNYIAGPLAGVLAIWGVTDAAIYTAAGCGAVASIFTFVKVCLKK